MNAANLTLFWQLLRRDVQERYTGTVLGMAWLVLQPLLMLLVYALVFGDILQLRTGVQASSGQFAAFLFTGLMGFNALAEVVARSPALLLERRELLLHSPLPAVLLPLIPVASSLVLEFLSLLLLVVWLCWQGQCPWWGVALFLPVLLVRVLLSLGLAYWLAVLGVFLRDLRQLMPPLLGVLLLLSAIVYPPEVVPEAFQPWLHANPLAQLAQVYRAVLLHGEFPMVTWLGLTVLAMVLLVLGIGLFQRLLPRARYVL